MVFPLPQPKVLANLLFKTLSYWSYLQSPTHLDGESPAHLDESPTYLGESPVHLYESPTDLESPAHLDESPTHLDGESPAHLDGERESQLCIKGWNPMHSQSRSSRGPVHKSYGEKCKYPAAL